MYGIIINFTGFPASFSGSLLNFQKLCTMRDHAVKSELSHGHFKFSWNDTTKDGK